jgi:DNA-binding CsgD family transcriptional regulator
MENPMLEALGISPLEEQLYLAMIDVPTLELSLLAERAGAKQDETLAALTALIERGLVVRNSTHSELFSAVAPEVGLSGMLGEQEHLARQGAERLEQARGAARQVTERFRMRGIRHPLDLIEVIVGREAVLERFFEIQNSARSSVRGIDTPPYIGSPIRPEMPAEYVQLKAGIEYRALYSTFALNHPAKLADIAESQALGEQSRLLADPPLKLILVDDDKAMIGLSDEQTGAASALQVGPSALLDGLSRMFEVLWRFGVNFDAHSPDTAGQPTEDERKLLAMLALGMTDRQIAEHNRYSARTAQARVQRLMSNLGAETRFQAGLEAKARGWL